MMPTLSVPSIVAVIAIGFSSAAHSLAANAVTEPIRVDGAFLKAENLVPAGRLVRAYRMHDQEGEHVLIMSRREGPSPQNPDSGRVERIDLTAGFYTNVGPGKWTQDWTVRDNSDCPVFDMSAEFFSTYVTFTDLNKDGRVEVTVPYRLFCSGDTYLVKVILREGPTKLGIRGQSRVQYAGQAAYGGEHTYDPLLLTPPFAAYKAHMDKVWKRASDDKR